MVVNLDAVDDVGLDAALVFARIEWRGQVTGGWEATHADIVAETRLTEHRVKAALAVLRDRGWIVGERADRFRPTLTWRVVWAAEESSVTAPSEAPAPVTGESSVCSLEDVETQLLPPSPPSVDLGLAAVPAAEDPMVEEFAVWWSHYPRKVAKPAALRAYRAARKTTSKRELWDGTKRHLPDLESRPVDKVPHPATWLNQRRWEDDPGHAAQPVRSSGPRNALLDPNLMVGFPALGGPR